MDFNHENSASIDELTLFRHEKAHKFYKKRKIMEQFDILSVLNPKLTQYIDPQTSKGAMFSHLRWNIEMLSAQVGASAVVNEWLSEIEPLLISLPMIVHNKKKIVRLVSTAMQNEHQDLILVALECISSLCLDFDFLTLGKNSIFRLFDSIIDTISLRTLCKSKAPQVKSATLNEANHVLEKYLQVLVILTRFSLNGSRDDVLLKKIFAFLCNLSKDPNSLPIRITSIALLFEAVSYSSASFLGDKNFLPFEDESIIVGALIMIAQLFPELPFPAKPVVFSSYESIRMPTKTALKSLSLLFCWFLGLSSIPQSQYRVVLTLFPDRKECVDICRLFLYLKGLISQLKLDGGDLEVLDDALRILIPLLPAALHASSDVRSNVLDILVYSLQAHKDYPFDDTIPELLGNFLPQSFQIELILPFLPSPSSDDKESFWKKFFASMSSLHSASSLPLSFSSDSSSPLVDILSEYLSKELKKETSLCWTKTVILGKDREPFLSALKMSLSLKKGLIETIGSRILHPTAIEEDQETLISLLESSDPTLLSFEGYFLHHAAQIKDLLSKSGSIQLLRLASHFAEFNLLTTPILIDTLHLHSKSMFSKEKVMLTLLDSFLRSPILGSNFSSTKNDYKTLLTFGGLARCKDDGIRALAIQSIGKMLEIPITLMEAFSLPITLTTCRQKLLGIERIVSLNSLNPELLLCMIIGSLLWTPLRPFQEGLLPLGRKVLSFLSPESAWNIWGSSFQQVCASAQEISCISSDQDQRNSTARILVPLTLLLNLLMKESCVNHLMKAKANEGPAILLENLFLECWDNNCFKSISGLTGDLSTDSLKSLCVPILKVMTLMSQEHQKSVRNVETDILTGVLIDKALSFPDASLQVNALGLLVKRHPALLTTFGELRDLLSSGVKEIDWTESVSRLFQNYQKMATQKDLAARALISFVFGRISMSSRLCSSLQASNRRKIISAIVSYLPSDPFWFLLFQRASATIANFLCGTKEKKSPASFPKASHVIGFYNIIEELLSQASHAIPLQLVYDISTTLLGIIDFKQRNETCPNSKLIGNEEDEEEDSADTFVISNARVDIDVSSNENDQNDDHLSNEQEIDPHKVPSFRQNSEKKKGLVSRAITLLSRLLKLRSHEDTILEFPPLIQLMTKNISGNNIEKSFLFGVEVASSLVPNALAQDWLDIRLPYLTQASDTQLTSIFTQVVIPLLSQKNYEYEKLDADGEPHYEQLIISSEIQSDQKSPERFNVIFESGLLDRILNALTLLFSTHRKRIFDTIFRAAALLPFSIREKEETFSDQIRNLLLMELSSISDMKIMKTMIMNRQQKKGPMSWIPLALDVLGSRLLSKIVLAVSSPCSKPVLGLSSPFEKTLTSTSLSVGSKIKLVALFVSSSPEESIPLELKSCWWLSDAAILSESLSKIAEAASDLFIARPVISKVEEIAFRAVKHWVYDSKSSPRDNESTIERIDEELHSKTNEDCMINDYSVSRASDQNSSEATLTICNILFFWLQSTIVKEESRHHLSLRSDLLSFLSRFLGVIPFSLATRLSPATKALWYFMNPNIRSEISPTDLASGLLTPQPTLSEAMLASLGEAQFPVRQKALERLQKYLKKSLVIAKGIDPCNTSHSALIEEWLWPLANISLVPEARKRSGISAYSSVQEAALNLWVTCAMSMITQGGHGHNYRLPRKILLALIAALSSTNGHPSLKQSLWWWFPPTEALSATPRLVERLLVAFLDALCQLIADPGMHNDARWGEEVTKMAPLVRDRIIPFSMGSPEALRPKLASLSLRFLALAGETLKDGLLGPTLISGLRNREFSHREQCRQILREALVSWPLSISLPLITRLVHTIIMPTSAERFVNEFDEKNACVGRRTRNDEHGGFLKHVSSFTMAELLEHAATTNATPTSDIEPQAVARLVYLFVEASSGTLAREKATEQWAQKAVEVRQQRAPRAFGTLARLLPISQVLNELLPMLYKMLANRDKDNSELPSIARAILSRIGSVLRTHPSLTEEKRLQEGTGGALVLALVQHAYLALLRLLPKEQDAPDKTSIDLIIGRFGLSLISSLADDVLPLTLPKTFLNATDEVLDTATISPKETTPSRYTIDVLGPVLLSLILERDSNGSVSHDDAVIAESMRLLTRIHARWRRNRQDLSANGDKLMSHAVSRAVKLIVKERPEDISSTALISAAFSLLAGAVGDRKLLSDGLLRSIISSPRFTDRDLFSRMLQSEICTAGVGPFLRRFYACRRLAIVEAYDLADSLFERMLHASNDGIRTSARDTLLSFLSSYPLSEGRFSFWLKNLIAQMDHSWEESRVVIFELLISIFSKDIGDFPEQITAIKEAVVLKSLLLHLQDPSIAVRESADRLIFLLLGSDFATGIQFLEWCRSWLSLNCSSSFHKVGAIGIIKCHQAIPSIFSSASTEELLEEISLLLKLIISNSTSSDPDLQDQCKQTLEILSAL